MNDVLAALSFLLGVSLITAGAGLVYLPAAFLVSGLALVVCSWFYVRGSMVKA